MRYDEYRYLYPPRPDNVVTPSQLKFYTKQMIYGAQVKKNGTQNMIFVNKATNVVLCRTRHGDTEHKLWKPNTENMDWIDLLPGQGWYVFAAELMHNKTGITRDTNYIFDVLVNNGDYLVGTTFEDRYAQISELFVTHREQMSVSHYTIGKHLWVSNLHRGDFTALWRTITVDINDPEDEGIVLKQMDTTLNLCGKQNANNNSMLKCRISTGRHSSGLV